MNMKKYPAVEALAAAHGAMKIPTFGKGSPFSALSPEIVQYFWDLLKEAPSPVPPLAAKQWNKIFDFFDPWSIPMLFWKMQTLGAAYLPPKETMDRMRQYFLSSRGRTYTVQKQLHEISAAFEAEGIPFLVWKGAALAFSVYPDPAMRPGEDIDLLILPDHFKKARSILEALGYKSQSPWFEAIPEYGFAETFLHRQRAQRYLAIDMHWKIHPYDGARGLLDEKALFRRSVVCEAGSANYRVPSPVDALIIAALHIVLRHPHELQLIWVTDLYFLVKGLQNPQEWKDLLEQAAGWNARLCLERALRIASLWTNLPLPHWFGDFTLWPAPSKEERAVFYHALRSRQQKRRMLYLYWPRHASTAEKAAFLLRLIFPNPVYVRWKYPPPHRCLLPMAYLQCWAGWAGLFTGSRRQ